MTGNSLESEPLLPEASAEAEIQAAAGRRITEWGEAIERARQTPGFQVLVEAVVQELADRFTPALWDLYRKCGAAERQTGAVLSVLMGKAGKRGPDAA